MGDLFTFALAGGRRVHKEVVRWIRLHFNEELSEAKLGARGGICVYYDYEWSTKMSESEGDRRLCMP